MIWSSSLAGLDMRPVPTIVIGEYTMSRSKGTNGGDAGSSGFAESCKHRCPLSPLIPDSVDCAQAGSYAELGPDSGPCAKAAEPRPWRESAALADCLRVLGTEEAVLAVRCHGGARCGRRDAGGGRRSSGRCGWGARATA